VIATIGIDDYAAWPPLSNAVSDAREVMAQFVRLGFEPATTGPLFDRAATGAALLQLVTDDLAAELGPEDELVLFFAGHGSTTTRQLASAEVRTGYIIPADAESSQHRTATWISLQMWLHHVARLPAKHILVILDACYSGIGLGELIRWRDRRAPAEPLADLRARQSRRVITSTLDDQRALDSGPMPGHSLFTGCLIEALTGGLARTGRCEATALDLAQYVRERVTTYPDSRQTPIFGALELHEHGELVFPLRVDLAPSLPGRQPGDDAAIVVVPERSIFDPEAERLFCLNRWSPARRLTRQRHELIVVERQPDR
jgi:hypothetical protein